MTMKKIAIILTAILTTMIDFGILIFSFNIFSYEEHVFIFITINFLSK